MFSFGVDSPCCRDNPIEEIAFNLYIMEQEGLLSTDDEEKEGVDFVYGD